MQPRKTENFLAQAHIVRASLPQNILASQRSLACKTPATISESAQGSLCWAPAFKSLVLLGEDLLHEGSTKKLRENIQQVATGVGSRAF